MSGYEYDVFISYSRGNSSGRNAFWWVRNHFHRKLADCLADHIAPAPKVYIDKQMERGVHWPSELERALLHSKIMIPVLAPYYFESRWCMAEWRSMTARERLLGLASRDRPHGLIFPVLFSDSENFPREGRERSWWDFKRWAIPEESYKDTREWPDFHREVSRFAAEIVNLLKRIPQWQPGWPVERPDPPMLPPPPLPRF